MNLIKDVRDVERFNHILGVLFEEGFDVLIERIKLKRHISLVHRIKSRFKKEKKREHHVIFRRTLERLGPTFIKLGQILSVRPDLVPKEYLKELEKLQDSVEPFPYEQVREIVKQEFGKNIESLFLHFEKKPLASASISQVHKAVLKNGDIVAVKIQRPNVRKIMETDIDIMFYFARLLEKHIDALKRYRPEEIIKEFKDWTDKELDFRIEARNAKRFYYNFKGSKTVYIPKIYDEFSTERVLTLEFIEGVELHNIPEIRRRKHDFDKVITNGFEALMTQVFVHGIFHGDPHPGNLIVRKDNSIALIDFGIVGYFDEKMKGQLIDLLYGLAENNLDTIIDSLLNLGMPDENLNREELKADIAFVVEPLRNQAIKDIKLSLVLEELLDIALRHRLRMPASFVLFGKSVITIEGVALEYDPNFKLMEKIKPFVEKLVMKRYNPVNAWKRIMHNLTVYSRFAESLPEKAEKALDKIQKGSIKIDIEDTDIKKLALEIDRSSNRVAYGLLIAALLVTSAILINIEKGPEIAGIPLLAFFSFILASFMALVLFLSIVKEKFYNY